ncbi:MAG: Hsp33 family molecular chaperone HslO [Gammaproteobacteria bacterium]
MTHDRDLRQRFLFEHLAVRGELVHLNQTWQEIQKRHEYPENLQHIMGQMAAASLLLSATLKFKGSLIMQIQGNGPLSIAVMEATSERTLRGMAQWQDDVSDMNLLEMVGDATLRVTIMPEEGERYQGIVDLSTGDIGLALEDYMRRSQQLETRLWLFSDSAQAGGMLLQKMPNEGEAHWLTEDGDAWSRVTHLADTVTRGELAELEFEALLHRLFHEEDVRVFEKQPVSFRCSCTRERVENVLRMLGYEETQSLLESQTKIGVNCEFCNHYYEFDKVDVEQLFATNVPTDTPTTRQ